jgi:hypothetical protein
MIGEILSHMVEHLDRWLNDPRQDLQECITRLRDEVKYLQLLLDSHSRETPPTEPIAADGFAERKATDINDRQHSAHENSQDVRAKRQKFIDRMMSEESAHYMETPFFCQKDLIKKRGWTKDLIRQLLGRADWKSPNPHRPGAAEMLCWQQDRVLAAEDTPAFQEFCRKTSK